MGEDWKLELKPKEMQQAKVGHAKRWVGKQEVVLCMFTLCQVDLLFASDYWCVYFIVLTSLDNHPWYCDSSRCSCCYSCILVHCICRKQKLLLCQHQRYRPLLPGERKRFRNLNSTWRNWNMPRWVVFGDEVWVKVYQSCMLFEGSIISAGFMLTLSKMAQVLLQLLLTHSIYYLVITFAGNWS